ncbi:MAG: DUF1987 domain-containing protein [Cytophagales bacterium]
MEVFHLDSKQHTPYVHFDPITGDMKMKGRSTPENSVEYYSPILDWLDNYVNNPAPVTTVNVHFEYFNTSSSKCILDVFKRFAQLYKNGKEVKILWYYEQEDEDMQEAGEDYSDILGVPFDVLEISE